MPGVRGFVGDVGCRIWELALEAQSWRHAYEKQVQETEALKRQGGETALAAQWRQRYEKLSHEKVGSLYSRDLRSNLELMDAVVGVSR